MIAETFQTFILQDLTEILAVFIHNMGNFLGRTQDSGCQSRASGILWSTCPETSDQIKNWASRATLDGTATWLARLVAH